MIGLWIMLIACLSLVTPRLDAESVDGIEPLHVAEQNDSFSASPYWRHGPRAVGYLSTALEDDYADQGGDPGEQSYDSSTNIE